MSASGLEIHKPSLAPSDLTASVRINEDVANTLDSATGLELPVIVEKLVTSNRKTCIAGDCALRATCEFAKGYTLEGMPDPPNYYAETEVPAHYDVAVTCSPHTCKDTSRSGIAIDKLVDFVRDAETATTTSNLVAQVSTDSATQLASEAIAPGQRQVEEIMAQARRESQEIMTTAQEEARVVLRPFLDQANLISEQGERDAATAKGAVLEDFRQSNPWLSQE